MTRPSATAVSAFILAIIALIWVLALYLVLRERLNHTDERIIQLEQQLDPNQCTQKTWVVDTWMCIPPEEAG